MKGFVFYLDTLFACFIAIIALIVGMQLIASIVSSDHSRFEVLARSTSVVSEKVIGTCFDNGGVAYCDSNYVRKGIIDERVTEYTPSSEVRKYEEDNRINFSFGLDNDDTRGVFCIIRLLKVHGENREVWFHVCAE